MAPAPQRHAHVRAPGSARRRRRRQGRPAVGDGAAAAHVACGAGGSGPAVRRAPLRRCGVIVARRRRPGGAAGAPRADRRSAEQSGRALVMFAALLFRVPPVATLTAVAQSFSPRVEVSGRPCSAISSAWRGSSAAASRYRRAPAPGTRDAGFVRVAVAPRTPPRRCWRWAGPE